MPKVGDTPLINVEGIYAKLECVNPCGSVKDRIAKYIIEKSEEMGALKSGMTIVEATSGNTGVAFSYYGREKGYDVTIIMPENMTDERKDIIKSLGANLILCSKAGSFAEAVRIRDELAKKAALHMVEQYGYCVGISSGANFVVSKEIAEKADTVVTIFPDGFEKYRSARLKTLR